MSIEHNTNIIIILLMKLYVGVAMSSNGSGSERFTQSEIAQISKRIPRWEVIAKSTGIFEEHDIEAIKLDHINYTGPVEKACRMLDQFQSRLGSRTTLVSALKDNGMIELAGLVQSKQLQRIGR